MSLREVIRPALTTLFTASVAVSAVLWPGAEAALWLSAKTVLIVPGNNNPDGAGIESKLNGYLDDTSPNFGFPGYTTVKVPWLSDSFDFDPGYAVSQADGVDKLRAAMTQYRDVDDAEDIDRMVVVGYSSGAIVVVDEMKALDNTPREAIPPEQVEFVVFGSPHRPNGGVFARFPGFTLGDVVFSGPDPDTRYELTDIGYEYDPISDFPAYPLMPLTLLNAALGFQYLHVNYVGPESDLANAIDDPAMTYYDQTRGIRYVTIAAPHLPLLMPLYRVIDDVPVLRPFVGPILTLIEPALKVLVDLGYRRDIPVGEPLRAGLLPRIDIPELVADLAHAAVKGVNGAWADITGTPVPDAPHPAPTHPHMSMPAGTHADVKDSRSTTPPSRITAEHRRKTAESDEPAPRDRPDRQDRPRRVSAAVPEKRDPANHHKKKVTSDEVRPAHKSGAAKMDSMRTSNRRQAADAA